MEHTPGPWEVLEYAINKNLLSIYGRGDIPICNIFISNRERAITNARLIAAAPDLLTACKADKAYSRHITLCPTCRKGPKCQEGLQLWAKAGDLRDAAIAKAEGD